MSQMKMVFSRPERNDFLRKATCLYNEKSKTCLMRIFCIQKPCSFYWMTRILSLCIKGTIHHFYQRINQFEKYPIILIWKTENLKVLNLYQLLIYLLNNQIQLLTCFVLRTWQQNLTLINKLKGHCLKNYNSRTQFFNILISFLFGKSMSLEQWKSRINISLQRKWS